jgi:hypothetical protein
VEARTHSKKPGVSKNLTRNQLKIKKMVTVIMSHEVKDFKKWKAVYDADQSNRAKAGVKDLSLYTSVKNPNDVTMIFEAPNAGVLEAYTTNPRVQEEMKEAGVISKPVSSVLNKV